MERPLIWLRDAVVTAGLLLRQAIVSLRYNWGVGLLSLALAVSLWVFVTEREDPERTASVPGSVPIEQANVPAGQAVCSISEESVTLRVRAPESVLEGLSAGDFRATVNLFDVTTEEVTVPVRLESNEAQVEVVDISPSQVRLRLESVASRTVPVETNLLGAPPRGFEQQEITVEPEEAVVTGPMCLVGRVESVTADANLAGSRTTFEETLRLQPQDELGGLIRGVTVEPDTVTVRVEVAQVEFSAGFVVRPDVRGVPADGHRVTGVQVDPPFVLVSGRVDVLQSIDAVQGIETEAVTIDGATADVIRRVALRLPDGTRSEQPVVTVRVSVAPAQSGGTQG